MKKEVNKSKKKIIVYIIFGLIVAYLIYAVYLLLKQPSDKVVVESGILYSEETDIGYIIRNEQVVRGNNYKNGMEQIKTEGEKTAKGESIYRYYSKNEDELTKQISDLDKKIQETLEGQTDLFSSDLKILENQLDIKIEQLNKLTDMSKITEYKKQINDLITKKAKIAGEKSQSGSHLKQLYTERTKLENQLNSGAEYINAPTSGIVSYKVDGLEETLTANNFSAINKQFLDNLNLKTGQLIATNNECGKIIDNFQCYIATISKSEEAKTKKVGDNLKIRLSNNETIEAKIAYLSQENEQETLLILEINKQISQLANYRKITFDLIWWSSSGLKVPNKSIIEENEIKYVVRNRAGYLSKIPVNIEKQNDKYCIIENYSIEDLKKLGFSTEDSNSMKKISIYDELIINPDLSKIE